MSLFTQSEASRFHSFLSQLDVSETFTLSDWPFFPDAVSVPQAEGTEELAKATRSLMALDSASGPPVPVAVSASLLSNRQWPDPPAFSSHLQQPQKQQPDLFYPPPPPLTNPPPLRHSLLAELDHEELFLQPHQQQQPSNTFQFPAQTRPPSQTSPPSFTQSSPHAVSPPNTRKRSSASRDSEPLPSNGPPKKRARGSPSSPSADGSTQNPVPTRQAKAHLLTTSQKKANHIQSEQKRRANIRQGYELLCEIVPSLREAIKAEEQSNSNGGSNGKKKLKATRGTDGRAGPKSESAVLQKTIDHIKNLAETRAALLARLHRARGFLHPQHPALIPTGVGPNGGPSIPIWERTWDGGAGLEDEDEDDSD